MGNLLMHDNNSHGAGIALRQKSPKQSHEQDNPLILNEFMPFGSEMKSLAESIR
jgi:hypothetical protein